MCNLRVCLNGHMLYACDMYAHPQQILLHFVMYKSPFKVFDCLPISTHTHSLAGEGTCLLPSLASSPYSLRAFYSTIAENRA